MDGDLPKGYSTPYIFSVSRDTLGKLNNAFHTWHVTATFDPTSEPMKTGGSERGGRGPIIKGDREQPSTSSWADFTQRTTIHGLRFAWEQQGGSVGKLLWLLLLLVCGGLMGYQVIDRVLHFYDHPVTVNVDLNFNKTLHFPAVTLCNQNSFRATKAVEQNRYRLLEAMFGESSGFNSSWLLQQYNASDIRLDELFLSTAHDKRDFIVDCQWRGQVCGPDNFTQVLTDHGVCFTFTPLEDYPLAVSSPGSDSGLKLTLNAEQYEYMPGPHDAGGIKMLLHNEKEFPQVAELGLAIPPGTHTYVGIQVTKVENLPPPHGHCKSDVSPHFEDTCYTRDNCQLTCLTQHVTRACGCRHHYMPATEGNPPVCTLQQFYDCFLKTIDHQKNKILESCNCPVACSYYIYDPVLSFATTSAFATQRLLAVASRSTDLEASHLKALETTERMEAHKFQNFLDREQQTRTKLDILSSRLLHDVRNVLKSSAETLTKSCSRMEEVWSQKQHLYRWQEFNILKNFMRVRDAMSERTFDYVALGYQEFASLIESRIKLFRSPNMTSPEVRQSLYLLVKTSLEAKIDLATRTLANYTELVNIYSEGTPLFNYPYLEEPLADNFYITPKPLLRHALNHSDLARQYCPRLREDIVNFTSALRELEDLVTAAYENQSIQEEDIRFTVLRFLVTARNYYHSKSVFSNECIDYPVSVVKDRREVFEALWHRYEASVQSSLDDIRNLQTSLDNLEQSVLKDLHHSLATARLYARGSDVRKVDVARELTSRNIYAGMAQLEIFFQTLRSRGWNLYDNWQQIADHTADIWTMVIDDEDMHLFYVYRNLTNFLRNVSDVRREVAEEYEGYRQRYDIRDIIGTWDDQFLSKLQIMQSELAHFLTKTVIGEDFIRENAVQLDIFHRENHYEHVTQQVAYDGFALLCDIGGSMGLFMGASLLSVGELIDLFFRQTFHLCLPHVTG